MKENINIEIYETISITKHLIKNEIRKMFNSFGYKT